MAGLVVGSRLSQSAGLLRATYRSNPSVLARREHFRRADLRCGRHCDGRRIRTLFGARAGAVPSAGLFAVQSGQTASVLAPVAAPGTSTFGAGAMPQNQDVLGRGLDALELDGGQLGCPQRQLVTLINCVTSNAPCRTRESQIDVCSPSLASKQRLIARSTWANASVSTGRFSGLNHRTSSASSLARASSGRCAWPKK